MRWQSLFKATHTWIGLIFGSFLCLTCLSGGISVFRSELEAAFSPSVPASAAQADLDVAVLKAMALNPDAKLTRVLLPEPSRHTFVLTLESEAKRQRKIIIDAGTGAIVGELNLPWLDWIVDLHHNLLFGHIGRLFVGGIGIVLLVTSATGLCLWLLRNPSWKALVAVPTAGPKRRIYFALHRAVGLWAYSFLILLSFTGIALAYPDAFRVMFGKPARMGKTKQSPNQPLRPVADYVKLARAAVDNAQLTELRLPKSGKDPINVRFRMESDLGTVGRNEIAMDAAGQILGIRRVAREPTGVRMQGSFTPIHYAEVGGLATKIAWSLAGVAPTVLFVTGILVWFRKNSRRDRDRNQRLREPEREFLMTRLSL